MKGFIEVTTTNGKFSIRLSAIVSFGPNGHAHTWVTVQGHPEDTIVEGSYDAIKKLIEGAGRSGSPTTALPVLARSVALPKERVEA